MSKQKGLAPILIVLLIALGLGGYLIYQKQAKPVSVPQQYIQSTPTPTSNPESSDSTETANWKTYTNNKLRYSFKYPQTWSDQTDEIANKQNIIKFSFTENDKQYFMFVGTGGRGGPAADEIKGDNPTYNGSNFSRRTWIKDGKPFFIIAIPDQPNSVGGGIEFNIPQDNIKSYTETFDQILSTFKFLDQADDAEGKFCGGIAANLPENQCPKGYICQSEGNYPDAGGKCVKEQ